MQHTINIDLCYFLLLYQTMWEREKNIGFDFGILSSRVCIMYQVENSSYSSQSSFSVLFPTFATHTKNFHFLPKALLLLLEKETNQNQKKVDNSKKESKYST